VPLLGDLRLAVGQTRLEKRSFSPFAESPAKTGRSNENHPGFHRGGDFDVS
jgi:hypothetical protein